MLVEKIMRSPVYTVRPEMPVYEAMQFAEQKQIRHLPVLDGEKLVGIVTDRDFREARPSSLFADGAEEILKTTPVSKIMHSPVVTVHGLDFFDEAVKLMYEYKVGCLPVLSQGRVVGIVTELDVFNHLVSMLGILSPGNYLEVDIPDKPGVLAEITQIIKNHGVNLSSVLLCPGRKNGHKCLVLRLEALNIGRITEEIARAGYSILWPVSTGG